MTRDRILFVLRSFATKCLRSVTLSSMKRGFVPTLKLSGAPHDTQKGLTVIGLAVVTVIIALFAVVSLVVLNEVRLNSRDAARISDVREIESALSLYHKSRGRFPIAASEIAITGDDSVSQALEGNLLVVKMPTDPLHDTYTYRYRTDGSGSTFILTFCLEGNGSDHFSKGCDNSITP